MNDRSGKEVQRKIQEATQTKFKVKLFFYLKIKEKCLLE
jgi:hypothetical protein